MSAFSCWQYTSESLFEKLGSSTKGLSSTEAAIGYCFAEMAKSAAPFGLPGKADRAISF